MALITVLIFFLLPIHLVTSNPTSPKINLPTPLPPSWQYISPPQLNHPAIYSPKNVENISISCVAPYPIRWNLTGYTLTHLPLLSFPSRTFNPDIFTIYFSLSTDILDDLSTSGISLSISCEKLSDFQISDKLLLFVFGNPSNSPLISLSFNQTVTNSKAIPCPTRNPLETVSLFKLNGNMNTFDPVSESVTYSPTDGFSSDAIFEGVYQCRQGDHSLNVTALTAPSILDGFDIFPKTPSISAFTEEILKFRCLSKSTQNVNLTVTPYDPTIQIVPIPTGYQVRYSGDEPEVSGKAVCTANDPIKPTTLKKWDFKFLQTTELHLHNSDIEHDKQLQCLWRSSIKGKRVMSVNCQTAMECDFLITHCVRKRCNIHPNHLKRQTKCSGRSKTDFSRSCVALPWWNLGGMVNCYEKLRGKRGGDKEVVSKDWEYFTGLDKNYYTNWRDAPPRELIKLNSIPSVLYVDEPTVFVCTAVLYLFTDKLNFQLKLKDGEMKILEGDGVNVNISRGIQGPPPYGPFRIDATVKVNLPLDAVGIECFAGWWNSTDVVEIKEAFETRQITKPQIIRKPQTPDGSQVEVPANASTPVEPGEPEDKPILETVYVGTQNFRLTCFATGDPPPDYTWYYNGTNATEVFPELTIGFTNGTNGRESFLEFPVIEASGSGKYAGGEFKCVAVNKGGKVEQEFRVQVADKKNDSRVDLEYVFAIIGGFVVILGVVVGILFVFVRKYRRSQEMLRNLTDQELEEFFEGNPELLGDGGGKAELIDFMPYNKGYEIAKSDLDFAESGLLGSGEFANVFRGKIVSKERPVALKVTKPSNDVTHFKSLLSEVKIMIYLGCHDNIVALIGVCTEEIKNRSIYIATDICDLGSLQDYLRKCRPHFVNLVNPSQEIDMSLQQNNEIPWSPDIGQVTTIDLVNFCAQIASGMEYLSSKAVIHGDLATRNVLLTADKTCKISDFGLSKKLYESSNYVKKSKAPLPWRWMAIESLRTLTFSTSSDVWAYGVTLYEIFTLGDLPFPNETWSLAFVGRLEDGMRMGRPKYSTQEIFNKISACWDNEPELRPSFTILRAFFEILYDRHCNPLGQGEGQSSGLTATSSQFPRATVEHDYYLNIVQPVMYQNAMDTPSTSARYANAPLEISPPGVVEKKVVPMETKVVTLPTPVPTNRLTEAKTSPNLSSFKKNN